MFTLRKLMDVCLLLMNGGRNARLHVPFAPCAAAVLVLHAALLRLLRVFFDNFQSDCRVQQAAENRPIRDVEENADVFQFDIAALYQLQTSWASRCVHGQLPTELLWTVLAVYPFCACLYLKLRVLLALLRLDVRDGKDLRNCHRAEHQHRLMLWE